MGVQFHCYHSGVSQVNKCNYFKKATTSQVQSQFQGTRNHSQGGQSTAEEHVTYIYTGEVEKYTSRSNSFEVSYVCNTCVIYFSAK